MAHLLNLESARVVLGDRVVLDGLSLGLDDGARVGVVGRNGDGKSTLLRVLAGVLVPDSGRASRSSGLRVGRVVQEDVTGSGTVRDAVLGSYADDGDHVWASDPRVRDVVNGLLGDIEESVPGGWFADMSVLSGGQRRRVVLAAVLVGDYDLLILDEPTNHLDVDGVSWLAQHLKSRWPPSRGGLVVVTHDRWFLDEVCERTWEVHDGIVDMYDGGYAAYILARAERGRIADATERKRANLVRKELAWLRRGPPARTSKPKFRIDAAEALIADEPPPRDSVELLRTASARLGKDVVDLEDVTFTVGSRLLLDGVTWRVGPGDRLGIVGANGSGKTTLLRLITGDLSPHSGRVKRGKTIQVAVLSQHLRELEEVFHLRVAEVIEREKTAIVVAGKEVSATQLVERLGFTNARAWTRVTDLSGGERRRLQLARLLMHEPNVLLLDEPTNDLDTDTLAAMEDVLDSYAGTMIVVSHDRYLLERLTDRQLGMLGDGQLRDLVGGVDQYLSMRADLARSFSSTLGRITTSTATSGVSSGPSAAELRTAKKEAARLERQLERLAARETQLHGQLATQATDHAAVSALSAQLDQVLVEKATTEDAWLDASEHL